MKRRAFTWVELLVVIAILCVLSVLGFPFFAQMVFFTVFGWIWGLCRLVLGLVHEPMAVLLAVSGFVLHPLVFHLFVAPIAKRFERAWTFRKSFAVSTMLLLVATSGIALAAGFHDALWFFQPSEPIINTGSGDAIRRYQSTNCIKQLGIGTHDFHDTHDRLPYGATILEDGRLGHGWMMQLLPFCEQSPLYEKIDLSKPWDDPVNEPAFKERVVNYQSPYLKNIERHLPPEPHGFARTDYSANQFVLPVGRSLRMGEISDGTSNTMLSGEIAQHLPAWGDPINGRDLRLGINRSEAGFGSKHTGGMNIGLCDGAVRFLSDSTDPKILEALASPNGGEAAPAL